MHHQTQRIQFLDFMRGFAVIIMVMGHSIDAVLNAEVRETLLYSWYNIARGFTAPIFLFVSGCAFSIATEKRWAEFLTPGRVVVRRVLKIVLLFLIGYALHLPYFSLNKLLTETRPEEFLRMFQVDILQCVAASLLILQILILIFRTPRRFAVATLSLGGVMVLATPLVWNADTPSVLHPLLVPYLGRQHPTVFPLLPYGAYLFAGVVIGHLFLVAYRYGRQHAFFRRLLVFGVGLSGAGFILDLLPVTVYPPHDYWRTSPNLFLIRLGIIVAVTSGFFFVRRLPEQAAVHLVALGQASLLVYVVHLVLAYGSAVQEGLAQMVGRVLSALESFGVGLVVLLAMLVMVHVWRYLERHHPFASRLLETGVAGWLLFTFLTQHY